MSITIKRAKLTKNFTLDLTYLKTAAKISEDGLLTYAIAFKTVKDIHSFDPKLTEDLHVSSYAIGGPDDDRGIVISGHRILPNSKALIMNTPFTRFEDSDNNGYKYIDELKDILDEIEAEIIQYLDGKHAPEAQTAMEFPDAADQVRAQDMDNQEETEPAPKKRGRKKKEVLEDY